jgi:hypothetical protein
MHAPQKVNPVVAPSVGGGKDSVRLFTLHCSTADEAKLDFLVRARFVAKLDSVSRKSFVDIVPTHRAQAKMCRPTHIPPNQAWVDCLGGASKALSA